MINWIPPLAIRIQTMSAWIRDHMYISLCKHTVNFLHVTESIHLTLLLCQPKSHSKHKSFYCPSSYWEVHLIFFSPFRAKSANVWDFSWRKQIHCESSLMTSALCSKRKSNHKQTFCWTVKKILRSFAIINAAENYIRSDKEPLRIAGAINIQSTCKQPSIHTTQAVKLPVSFLIAAVWILQSIFAWLYPNGNCKFTLSGTAFRVPCQRYLASASISTG